MNQDHIKRSKIYTYFYGRNTVFQQFLLVVGVLFFLLSGVALDANKESYYDNIEELREEYRKYDYGTDEYKEAYKEYEEYLEENSPDDSFLADFNKFLGFASIATGIIWILIKKIAFNKDGEKEYDEELADIIAKAKEKALDKLNIISEQIERVDPVVLDGVAYPKDTVIKVEKSVLASLVTGLLKLLLKFSILVLGLLAVGIFVAIAGAASSGIGMFIFMFLIALAVVGFVGYKFFIKYEQNSYVSPKKFKNLAMFSPVFKEKLGSDDAVRVSLPAITVYMFGDDQLYVYYQYVDIVTGEIFNEGVQEYFYEDINGVTSTQETKKFFKRCGFLKLSLQCINYLKETITVVSSGCSVKSSYIVDMGNSLLDTQFIGMRNLIRQKKAEK